MESLLLRYPWIYPGTPSPPAQCRGWKHGSHGWGPKLCPHTPFRGASGGPCSLPSGEHPRPPTRVVGTLQPTPFASWSAPGSPPTALRGSCPHSADEVKPWVGKRPSPGHVWAEGPGPWTLPGPGPSVGSRAGRRLEIKLRCVGPAASWVDSPLLKAHLPACPLKGPCPFTNLRPRPPAPTESQIHTFISTCPSGLAHAACPRLPASMGRAACHSAPRAIRCTLSGRGLSRPHWTFPATPVPTACPSSTSTLSQVWEGAPDGAQV